MNSSLGKSLNKSHGSYKHVLKISGGGGGGIGDFSHDEQSILLDHDNNNDHSMSRSSVVNLPDRREFIVKIDGGDNNNSRDHNAAGGGKIWRESSYEFWKDGGDRVGSNGESFAFPQQHGHDDGVEDPPSKLIGLFLHKQRASGDMSLDMDLEMDELRRNNSSNLPPVAESPTQHELEVSFQHNRRSSNLGGPEPDGGGGEVLKCTSNDSFQRKSRLLRSKTRSRLMDPPEQPERKCDHVAKSGGLLAKAMDEEDDDPFLLDDDLPEEFRNANFSALTLVQWVSLVLILGAFICGLSIPSWKRKSLWKLQLWKWEVLVLVLICGRLVSGLVIRVVVFFVERNFLLRKRVLYFVYGLRKAVQNCLWLGLVLLAWHFLFDKKVERETNTRTLRYVTKILVCLLVGTLLWLVKTLIVKVLASSFHVSTYFDRIQESLFNQYVIETLSGPPLIELQHTNEEEAAERLEAELQNAGANLPPELRATAFQSPPKSGRVIGSGGLSKTSSGITIDHLHKLNPRNVSAWNMKRLMKIVRHGALSTLDEQIRDSINEDESATQIRNENEAKCAARKIFQNVSKQGSEYINLEDLMRFMQEDEALKTLSLFEGASEIMEISKSCLKNWVVNAFRERRALALTLNDTKTAVNKLHQMVNIIVGIIIGIIWLIILGIATSKFLLLVSSQIVVAAFIFGNTLKTIFEALIFLFVIHPFDVGDRCEIDGVQMVVEEMNILTTTFLRYDNQKIVYLNSLLATKAIANYYRSPDMGDAVDFCIHIATPTEKIAVMRQRILSYIENKKEHWYTSPMVVLKDIEGFNRLKYAVWLTHKMNHQNMGEKWARRALLVEEMVKIFKELDIEYRLHPLDIISAPASKDLHSASL